MSDPAPNRLFLLDGMALAYRSHFAFITNPIRNSKGQNTSAIFGFANTLLSILDQEAPTHLAACFDTSVPTERHIIYPEYKANRESMPEDLRAQIPEIIRMLEAFRIPILRIDGYEADDTIGTLTRMADETDGFASYMVSQDKDLGQLISPSCFLWRPGKRGNEHEIIDVPTLLEHWNIKEPSQVIDILALMGDASDNIPGIPGIGEKTAKTLIEEFGSVENLLAHTDQLKGKRRENVEANADKAILSKKLATINRHVPLSVGLDALVRQTPDEPALRNFLQEYELRTIQARLFGKNPPRNAPANLPPDDLFAPVRSASESLDDSAGHPVTVQSDGQLTLFEDHPVKTVNDIPHDYILINTEEERLRLARLLEQAPSWCFDTETTGLDPLTDSLLGIAFCMEPHKAWYVSISDPSDLEPFRSVFAGPAEKIGHNLKFDIKVMRAAGIKVAGPFFDSMLAHALVNPGLKHGMDSLAETMLSYQTIKLADIAPPGEGKGVLDTAAVPVETMARYSAEDADITFQLAGLLRKEVRESGMEPLFMEIEMPLLPVLADMEFEGVRILPKALEDASDAMTGYLEDLIRKVEQAAGHPLNLNSPKQLGELLFGELKLVEKPKKTKTGQFVTDEETLSTLSQKHEVVRDILAYREAAKLKGTYLDALPRFISPADGRIHSQFHQLLTATGRLASQDPNLQNIPVRSDQGKLIRKAFVPRSDEYLILSADYSQIELRIMAALSGDEAMIHAFRDNRDIHTETASRVYGVAREDVTSDMRRAAKMVNFGIIYGISAFGLSQRLGCPRAEAAALIENYFTQFPGVKAYMDTLIEKATRLGYAETLCGRKRMLPDLQSANKNIRSSAERTAINTPIQGTAAEMIKIAMIRVHRLLEQTRSRLILQIHDELLIDLHKEEQELVSPIVETMRTALVLPHGVPASVEAQTGANWLEAH
ncbi:DNA polymerase I [Akkermansia sp. N21116]|uniref:DNA polymerase I n=1 Tax=Akkermansia sp. N21116 TaxID=3040764 RepID=UPI00244E9917|nr:DNA polymerase I [Akkermansia sp. N21116]WPX39694.1 DNA polymerase I [Akkermansia sp. N21116]